MPSELLQVLISRRGPPIRTVAQERRKGWTLCCFPPPKLSPCFAPAPGCAPTPSASFASTPSLSLSDSGRCCLQLSCPTPHASSAPWACSSLPKLLLLVLTPTGGNLQQATLRVCVVSRGSRLLYTSATCTLVLRIETLLYSAHCPSRRCGVTALESRRRRTPPARFGRPKSEPEGTPPSVPTLIGMNRQTEKSGDSFFQRCQRRAPVHTSVVITHNQMRQTMLCFP